MIELEIKYAFEPVLFNKVLEFKRGEHQVCMSLIESEIDKLMEKTNELTNEFPNFKFDNASHCFYNEAVEIEEHAAGLKKDNEEEEVLEHAGIRRQDDQDQKDKPKDKPKNKPKEKEKDGNKRMVCADCCYIL